MSLFVNEVLKHVASGQSLDVSTAERIMNALMAGELTHVQTAGLLAAMTVRGESVSEIVGFARAMRAHCVSVKPPYEVVDTCGTGGDGGHTFNISTAAAFVAAAGGVRMAKHGNRAVSSRSGSADVLQALGAKTDLSAVEALHCLDKTFLCFLFAQSYHPAMKHVAEARKQLGFRTIFNVLGPLTNPAGATRQVMGVFRADLVGKAAEALLQLGTAHALVVHGDGGIDEFSLQGETLVAEVRNGSIHRYVVTPEQVGLPRAPVSALTGGDEQTNARIIRSVLTGQKGPCRDVVVLNSAALFVTAGRVETLAQGARLAEQQIDSGNALRTLEAFVAATQSYGVAEVAQ